MPHFLENDATMPTIGTAPEKPYSPYTPSHSGKCPGSGGKRFTFPEGIPEDSRLEGLCHGCADPPWGDHGEIKGPKGRDTLLQTLWRTWRGNSPSEGGTILQGNCTPSEGGKGRGREDGCLGVT